MHGAEWSISGLGLPSAKENHHDTWNTSKISVCLSVIKERSRSRAARSGRGPLIGCVLGCVLGICKKQGMLIISGFVTNGILTAFKFGSSFQDLQNGVTFYIVIAKFNTSKFIMIKSIVPICFIKMSHLRRFMQWIKWHSWDTFLDYHCYTSVPYFSRKFLGDNITLSSQVLRFWIQA